MYYPCSIISQKPPPPSKPPAADPDRSSVPSTNLGLLSTYMSDTSNGRKQKLAESLMEGTKDDESPLPQPEPLSPMALLQRRKAKGKVSGSGTARATKEMLMERDRRGKMNEFYAKLNSTVPNLFPKATREKTIDETIAYIRKVEEQIMELEAQKEKAGLDRLHRRRNSSSSIDITFSGDTMFFGIQSMARKGLLTRVLKVFERHKAEVLATSIACNDGQQAMVTVTAVFNHSDRMVLHPEMAGQRIKSDLLRSL